MISDPPPPALSVDDSCLGSGFLPAPTGSAAAFCPKLGGRLGGLATLALVAGGLRCTGGTWAAWADPAVGCAITTACAAFLSRYPQGGWRCRCEGIDYATLTKGALIARFGGADRITVPCSAAFAGPAAGAGLCLFSEQCRRSCGSIWSASTGSGSSYSLGRFAFFRCGTPVAQRRLGAGLLLGDEVGWKPAALRPAIPPGSPGRLQGP